MYSRSSYFLAKAGTYNSFCYFTIRFGKATSKDLLEHSKSILRFKNLFTFILGSTSVRILHSEKEHSNRFSIFEENWQNVSNKWQNFSQSAFGKWKTTPWTNLVHIIIKLAFRVLRLTEEICRDHKQPSLPKYNVDILLLSPTEEDIPNQNKHVSIQGFRQRLVSLSSRRSLRSKRVRHSSRYTKFQTEPQFQFYQKVTWSE